MKTDGTLGVTIYRTQTIMLLKDQANIIKTLKHELTHVWLYEYGHNQNDDKTFGYEDVCEIVASSNDFVNETVKQFKRKDIEIKLTPNSMAIKGKDILLMSRKREEKN